MVRLKGVGFGRKRRTQANFNSTMVRLKGGGGTTFTKMSEFQFHYGTIKSNTLPSLSTTVTKFQFHYGTIKREKTNTAVR